jgi:hypothetical protein
LVFVLGAIMVPEERAFSTGNVSDQIKLEEQNDCARGSPMTNRAIELVCCADSIEKTITTVQVKIIQYNNYGIRALITGAFSNLGRRIDLKQDENRLVDLSHGDRTGNITMKFDKEDHVAVRLNLHRVWYFTEELAPHFRNLCDSFTEGNLDIGRNHNYLSFKKTFGTIMKNSSGLYRHYFCEVKGRGLFSEMPIRKNEPICWYGGKIRDRGNLGPESHLKAWGPYYVIDALESHKLDPAYWAGMANSPDTDECANCTFEPKDWSSTGIFCWMLVASRDIEANEQLLVKYAVRD